MHETDAAHDTFSDHHEYRFTFDSSVPVELAG